jgi:hypothetical protein
MHHRPGKSMGKYDALSRRANHSPGADDNCDITLLKPEFFAARTLEGMTVEGVERGRFKRGFKVERGKTQWCKQ